MSLPGTVCLNTVVLVINSGMVEVARRKVPNRRYTCNTNLAQVRTGRGWLGLSTVLGLLFVVGQAAGWQQLAARGLLLPTNPASSFFYILTGLHGLHLLGGIVLLVVALRTMRQSILGCAATYWHFLVALWLGVLALRRWV